MNQFNAMMEWEEGLLDYDSTIELFQSLIDTGIVCQLQGCYGRTASALIKSGDCLPKEEPKK
jgi:hypothetical protein